MPRQRSMSTEKMIELYKAYHLENPGTRYRASEFGKYLRDKGYEVSDKSIRRNMEFRQFLEENHAFEQEENEDLVTFNTLDVNTFLSYNRSREKLVTALQERDRYYYGVSEKAVKAIKKRKEAETKSRNLERQNRELTEESSALKNRLEETEERLEAVLAQRKEDQKAVQKMVELLEVYLYPENANLLLQRNGILEYVDSLMSEVVVEAKLMTSRDEMIVDTSESEQEPESEQVSRFDSVNMLRGAFDDN